MHVLQIEYPVPDYAAWKAAFDRDVLDREGSGVRRYRVLRPIDDPNYVLIDLEFENAGEAEAYLAALWRQFYSSRQRHPRPRTGARRRASSRWRMPRSINPGFSMRTYSSECVEGVFRELRLGGILGRSPRQT